MWQYKLMSFENKIKGRRTYQVAEASGQSDEAEGDGSVVVVDPEDQGHVQGRAWGRMHVRWWVEAQTLLLLVQAWAYLGVRWLEVEAHVEEEDHEDLVVVGRHQVVEVCKVQEVADDQVVEVQEGGAGHGVQGQVDVLGPWGLASPWLETLGRIQGPENDSRRQIRRSCVLHFLLRSLKFWVGPLSEYRWIIISAMQWRNPQATQFSPNKRCFLPGLNHSNHGKKKKSNHFHKYSNPDTKKLCLVQRCDNRWNHTLSPKV